MRHSTTIAIFLKKSPNVSDPRSPPESSPTVRMTQPPLLTSSSSSSLFSSSLLPALDLKPKLTHPPDPLGETHWAPELSFNSGMSERTFWDKGSHLCVRLFHPESRCYTLSPLLGHPPVHQMDKVPPSPGSPSRSL